MERKTLLGVVWDRQALSFDNRDTETFTRQESPDSSEIETRTRGESARVSTVTKTRGESGTETKQRGESGK